MKKSNPIVSVISSCALALAASGVLAQDWPQWRGANRDGKAAGFTAPKTWPKELTQKWKVSVGEGVATPSLVGDKLYVFARQEGGEITLCLDAATGKELWKEKYDSLGAAGPAQGFSGPRASPTVAEGKVVTLGIPSDVGAGFLRGGSRSGTGLVGLHWAEVWAVPPRRSPRWRSTIPATVRSCTSRAGSRAPEGLR